MSLGICLECNDKNAVTLMHKAWSPTDDSTGASPRPMCSDCAMEREESRHWQRTESLGGCEVCEDKEAVFMMEVIHFDRSTPPPVRYQMMCNNCAWKAFEAGTHEADTAPDGAQPTKPTEEK